MGFAVNEVLPHLNAIHGLVPRPKDGAPGGVEINDKHNDYVAEMQTVLVFVPTTFLARLHDEVRTARFVGDGERPDVEADPLLDAIFKDWLEPILTAFRSLLPTGKGGKYEPIDRTFREADTALRRWLRSDAFPRGVKRLRPYFA